MLQKYKTEIIDFVKRHSVIIAISIVVLTQLSFESQLLQVLCLAVGAFILVFFQTSITQYSLTKLKFTSESNPYNVIAIALMYIANALLVVGIALAVFGLTYMPKLPQ